MTAAQRAQKRSKRENRDTKKDGSWYCAGCKERHGAGIRCPTPRLFAKSNRLPKREKK